MNESGSSRTRPAGQTAGSSERPPRQLKRAALAFNLAEELASLKQEASWEHGDRNSRTLVMDSRIHIVLTALRPGARLREHQAAGQASIQTVAGTLRVQAAGNTIDLPVGTILALDSGVRHDVEGIEESAFLLTIATPAGRSGEPI